MLIKEQEIKLLTKIYFEDNSTLTKLYSSYFSRLLFFSTYDKNKLIDWSKKVDFRISFFAKADIYNNLGNTCWELGELENALMNYMEAYKIYSFLQIENKKQFIQTITWIANCYYHLKDFKNAKIYFERIPMVDPEFFNNPDSSMYTAHYILAYGETLKELSEHIEAIKIFEKGLNLFQKGGYPFRMAECYIAINDKKKALDYLIICANIRKEDKDFGKNHTKTKEAVEMCLKLANEIKKKSTLPAWIKSYATNN
jgi:tetratricopeptide (TPR) repeat protein